MRQPFSLIIGLTFICNILVGQEYDTVYGKPLIVLTETNPWLMVIGSDIPTFAMYENGRIIYKKIENGHLKLYEVTLTGDELEKLIRSLSVSDDLYKLKSSIEASSWTDQPSSDLILNFDSTRIISVYGDLQDSKDARKKTPKEFLKVYDKIKKYKNGSAKEWLPNKIEVMLWDYNYAPNKRPWLKNFPDLNSPSTIKYNNNTFSLFIDKASFDEFKKYYLSMGEKEAVEINDRKMAISYWLPFPNITRPSAMLDDNNESQKKTFEDFFGPIKK
ncbi:MAG: hypothetical protein V4511_15955 [Bacteroidota bacterium]